MIRHQPREAVWWKVESCSSTAPSCRYRYRIVGVPFYLCVHPLSQLPNLTWWHVGEGSGRSVVNSEGSGLGSSHQTRSRPKFVFVFGAENGLFGHFRPFPFSAENCFIRRFRSKNVICVGPKMLCSQLNRI